jgi:hypothetical protein
MKVVLLRLNALALFALGYWIVTTRSHSHRIGRQAYFVLYSDVHFLSDGFLPLFNLLQSIFHDSLLLLEGQQISTLVCVRRLQLLRGPGLSCLGPAQYKHIAKFITG